MMALLVVVASSSASAQFSYHPAGALEPNSGSGRADSKIYATGMRFPMESGPAFANSQVYRPGGSHGGGGGQCDGRNYSYPWRDNFCESRTWTMPLCPAGVGHQGQDIRPATCEDRKHWVVAGADGTVTSIGSYSVRVTAANGTRYDYLHMRDVAVGVGQNVSRGQRLGKVSNAFGGTPTTIHLHFNIRQYVAGVGSVYVPTYGSLIDSYQRLIGEPTTEFSAQFVEQSFPLASQPFEQYTGQTYKGHIDMKNLGSATWEPGKTFLGTTAPRDGVSPLAGPDWVSGQRAATVNKTVKPGEVGRFEFTLLAPSKTGEYRQYFNLVQEGVTWFSDGGSPPDTQLQIRVDVIPCDLGTQWSCGFGHGARVRCTPDFELEFCPNEEACVEGYCGSPPTEPDAGVPDPDAGMPNPTWPALDAGPIEPGPDGGFAPSVSGNLIGGCSAAQSQAPPSTAFGLCVLFAFLVFIGRQRASALSAFVAVGLVGTMGCATEAGPKADFIESNLTQGEILARATEIRDMAGNAGMTNGFILAGIASAETNYAHCWSEATWACQGPHSNYCGGPVIAGAGDGPCSDRQGGLGMFQFDAGNYDQTIAREGAKILDLEGNIEAAIDFTVNMVIRSTYISGVSTRAEALAWMNGVRIDNSRFDPWIDTVTHYYNGCTPTFGCWPARRARYRSHAQSAYFDNGGASFWYPAPAHAFTAQWVEQTFPLASEDFALSPNKTFTGFIAMRNVGTATWEPGATNLGTTQPRDTQSPIAGPDWLAPNRAATVHAITRPGEIGRFEFTVQAPAVAGDYPQFFNLVQEGVAWFGDQGGPPDNQLQVRVTVEASVDPPDAGPIDPADSGVDPIDGGVEPFPDAGIGPTDDGGGFAGSPSGSLNGGCSVGSNVPTQPVSLWALVVAGACVLRRHRVS